MQAEAYSSSDDGNDDESTGSGDESTDDEDRQIMTNFPSAAADAAATVAAEFAFAGPPKEAPAQGNSGRLATLSRVVLGVVAFLFVYLGAVMLLNPTLGLAPHGLSLRGLPASAVAEIRAFYFGSLVTFGVGSGLGAVPGSSAGARRRSLWGLATLLGLFFFGRLYSLAKDGPPEAEMSAVVETIEVAGALLAGGLAMVQQ